MAGRSLSVALLALAVGAASLGAPPAAGAQEQDARETSDESSDRLKLDFLFDYDPEELRKSVGDEIRFKRIWGPVGLAGYHIFPAAESGPYLGPPQRIWSNGFGTSLWRDPVTGWPLQ